MPSVWFRYSAAFIVVIGTCSMINSFKRAAENSTHDRLRLSPRLSRFLNIPRMSSTVSPTRAGSSAFDGLTFDNRNLRDLPVDPEKKNFVRQVPNAIFSLVDNQPVKNPRLVSFSPSALALLGLPAEETSYTETDKEKMTVFLGGNEAIDGSRPAAHCYCGHQFGNFAGQLGDGAAMYLGETINQGGERWELQLKGSGLTPFSRTADGRKVLRSSVREYLCSEAMHFLNIPTTRAGSLVTSDSTVQRDPMYDGGVIDERCSIVSRIAPNFFRFGSFEIFKPSEGRSSGARMGPSHRNGALKKQLLDHIIKYYADTVSTTSTDEEKYRLFFVELTKRTATLVAKWQACGFVHGVLNTDNMSIMGLTIDYGPYAFMEHYDPEFTPNGSDNSGRYTYERQPEMCKWNMVKLAEALDPLLPLAAGKDIVNQEFDTAFRAEYMQLFRAKLGLTLPQSSDEGLIEDLFVAMEKCKTDFTDAFQALTQFAKQLEDGESVESAKSALVENLLSRSATPSEITAMSNRKMKIHRLGMHPGQLMQLLQMLERDPDEVSHLFNGAPIAAIKEELMSEKRKLDKLTKTVNEMQAMENITVADKAGSDRRALSAWVERYAARLLEDGAKAGGRVDAMRATNPSFVLRNWVAQDAIEAAEKLDFSKVNTVLDMLLEPYNPSYNIFSQAAGSAVSAEKKAFVRAPPEWADSLICTCSS